MNTTVQKNLSPRNISLLLASTMTVMAGATLAPSLPGMEAAFQNQTDAEFWVKMIVAIPGLLIAISAPFIGKLIDQKGTKKILLLSLFGYGIFGSIGFFINDSLLFIFVSRVLLGITVAGIMVSCITLAGRYFSGPSLGQYMGLQAAFGSFGGVIFLAAAGLLADIHWTWPFLIYLMAMFLLPACAIFINEPRKNPVKNQPSDNQSLPEAESAKNQENGSKSIVSLCCILASLEVFLLYMIPLHFPFYAQQFDTISPSSTGFAIASMLLVSALVSLNYRRLSERLPFHVIHSMGLTIISLGFACLAFAASYLVAVVGLLIIGFGIGIVRPNVVVWLFAHSSLKQRGAISGRLTACFFLGQIICPVVTQPTINLFGYATSYLFTAILTILVAISITYIFKDRQVQEKALT